MKTIVLHDAITTISENAFQECGNVVKITLPPNLKTIHGNAFVDCWRVVEINLPSSLRFLCAGAFEHCESLTTLTFSPSLKTSLKYVGCYVFEGCYSLPDEVANGFEVHLKARDLAKYGSVLPADFYNGGEGTLRSIVIPDAVTTIEGCTLMHQTSIRELVLPAYAAIPPIYSIILVFKR